MNLLDRKKCIALVKESVDAGATQDNSCEILGLSSRTLQRWQASPDREDQRRGPQTQSPKSLTGEEKEKMLKVANSEEYRNLNPHKIVAKLADSGEYLASESSFYRLLKKKDQLTHRSRSRVKTKNPPRCLISKNPNEVWSWDITYLQTLVRGRFFYLYMIEDIFSRMIVGWRVEDCESAEYSAQLMVESCNNQKIEKGQIDLHADNGGPMKGCTMLATLVRLGVAPSFSRPRVSNDNPFSEALFKTLKYCPQFPSRPFETIEEARSWVAAFVKWYNEEHLHSEIRFVTPLDRHMGRDAAILKKRVELYEGAKSAHPLRWTGKIRNWSPISEVILNPGKEKKRQKELLRYQAA